METSGGVFICLDGAVVMSIVKLILLLLTSGRYRLCDTRPGRSRSVEDEAWVLRHARPSSVSDEVEDLPLCCLFLFFSLLFVPEKQTTCPLYHDDNPKNVGTPSFVNAALQHKKHRRINTHALKHPGVYTPPT